MKEGSYTNIDEYLALQPLSISRKLQIIRQIINETVPEATEAISYQMPSFRYFGMLAYFAAFKDHYSVFVSPEVLNAFREHLKDYELTKSGIRIPLSQSVPKRLLSEIIKYSALRNLSKAEIKRAAKKNK